MKFQVQHQRTVPTLCGLKPPVQQVVSLAWFCVQPGNHAKMKMLSGALAAAPYATSMACSLLLDSVHVLAPPSWLLQGDTQHTAT